MNDQRRRFLLHFPSEHRGAIANKFYEVIRKGEHSPKKICSLVFQRAVERLKQWPDVPGGGVQLGEVLRWMRDDKEAAMDLALECFLRENAAPEEKAKRDEEGERQGKLEYMSRFPATERQIAYLRKLRYEGEIRDKGHASQLIEERKQ